MVWVAVLVVALTGCRPGGLGPGAAHPLREPAVLEEVGRRALEKHGFEAIMSKAMDAGLVVKRSAAYAENAVSVPVSQMTGYWLTGAAIWRGVATAVEVVTAGSLVILGGLALVLTMEGDVPPLGYICLFKGLRDLATGEIECIYTCDDGKRVFEIIGPADKFKICPKTRALR